MHKPQIALVIAKRTAAGGDLPDFGGEGFRDARSAAVSPCGHADHAAAEPEPPVRGRAGLCAWVAG